MRAALMFGQTADTLAPVSPRTYAGNMCGVRVPGLPAVVGGAADPSLVLSWFIDRYSPEDRQKIYAVWRQQGLKDVLVSWPDPQVGHSPVQFQASCRELLANGFLPAVMLSAKPTSSDDARSVEDTLANILLVLPYLKSVCSRFCIGWELSLWLSPTDVQFLIDNISPIVIGWGAKLYVHFQEGYFAYQQPGKTTSDFWLANVGKLTGVFHQRDLSQTKDEYQARIVDCLQRFAGQFNFPADSGFGHPFDFIAMEITAELQFEGSMDGTTGDSWGMTALLAPGVNGPLGPVVVMGSGNGQ